MSRNTPKILITGGAGYLGSILTPTLLKLDYQVTVLDSLIFNQASLLDCCACENFAFVRGDICDDALMGKLVPQFDVIVPLAAIVGAPACRRNPSLTSLVNDGAYKKLISLTSKSQLVLFPTTNSGYGIGDRDSFCTEDSPLRPISEYGRTKVAIESSFLEKGNAITFRLATVFGMSPRMRMDLLVNDFVYRALKEGTLVLFEEHFRRNYIHVRDVAQAFVFGIENFYRMQGEPFNVGLSTANLTKRELAETIKKHLPNTYIHAGETGEDPDKRDYLVSNKKIESLGWFPRHSLDDGIAELIKGYEIIRPNIYSNV